MIDWIVAERIAWFVEESIATPQLSHVPPEKACKAVAPLASVAAAWR